MSPLELIAAALLLGAAFFFFAGTCGVLRFPDVFTRLHALTKADNLGLGLVVAALALEASSLGLVLKLGLIWPLVMLASAICSQLIARSALRAGVKPWSRR